MNECQTCPFMQSARPLTTCIYEVCDTDDRVLLADMGAGSVTATRDWLTRNHGTLSEMNIRITAVGVATNDPGAIGEGLCQHLQSACHTLDYLLDFCAHDSGVSLFRRLCRYYWDISPVGTAAYVNHYREMWDSDSLPPKA